MRTILILVYAGSREERPLEFTGIGIETCAIWLGGLWFR